MANELDRCHLEQDICIRYLAGDGPDKLDALMGLADWLAEEMYILYEAGWIVIGKDVTSPLLERLTITLEH